MKEALFWSMGKLLGKQALLERSDKTVLWIHQGLQPVVILDGVESQGLGILSLFSASDLSLEALQSQLGPVR
jgi:hypothetical protein